MSIDWSFDDTNLVTIRVSGMLTKPELDTCQSEIEPHIRQGNANFLVLLDAFHGWSREEGWGNISFPERNDPYIDKIAIVGDEKWRDLVAMFTMRDLRDVSIEYFEPDQESQARQWLYE